jgi:hypothetical protein
LAPSTTQALVKEKVIILLMKEEHYAFPTVGTICVPVLAVALVRPVRVPALCASVRVAAVCPHLALVDVGAAVAKVYCGVQVAAEAALALAVMPRETKIGKQIIFLLNV